VAAGQAAVGQAAAGQAAAGQAAAILVSAVCVRCSRSWGELRMKQQDPEFIPSSCCKNPGRSRQRKGPAGQRGQRQASGRGRQKQKNISL
jgi:hypothetical protein